jgi:hypothetical protein
MASHARTAEPIDVTLLRGRPNYTVVHSAASERCKASCHPRQVGVIRPQRLRDASGLSR